MTRRIILFAPLAIACAEAEAVLDDTPVHPDTLSSYAEADATTSFETARTQVVNSDTSQCDLYYGWIAGEYGAGEFWGIFYDLNGTALALADGTYDSAGTFTADIDDGNDNEGTFSGVAGTHVFVADIEFPGVTAGVSSGGWSDGEWIGSWTACI